MIETPDDTPHEKASPRRVLVALGVGGVTLLIAMLVAQQLGRIVGARHAPLKNAVQIELELVRANLGYELVLNGDHAASTKQVEQDLVRAEWYAQQMVQVCSTEHGRLFLAPIDPLRRKLAVLRGELRNFTAMTRERWKALQAGDTKPDPLYDEAFRQLALRGRETKAGADDVIRTEQGVLNTLQICLVIGAVLLASVVAMKLLRDLRQRQQIEIALQESEERFRCLYRNSDDAIMFLDENSFFDCNEAALRIFQIESYKEFCRKHPADISPPTQPDGTNSLTQASQYITDALREGSQRFDWIHMRADGTEFPTEVLLNVVHYERRRVLLAVLRDVMQRKESEERIRSNEEKLHSISEAALDAVIMMNPRGQAIHWNPAAAKMFGYSAEEAMGRDIHEILTPASLRDGANRALARFFQTGQGRAVGRTLELRAMRKAGEEFPIEISLAPIRIAHAWCAVAVIRDITDRKLADEKLRAEQRTLRRLIKAHDQERKLIAYEIHDGLAQQLVAAIMQCQVAMHNGAEPQAGTTPQLLDRLQHCLAETRRLISGVRPPILDEFGVVTAIQSLFDETRSSGGPEIEFHNQVTFERLDPVLENTIYRVIQEGLGNACRHSQSPRVRIDLGEEGGRLRIRVQDWGVGFEPLKVERGHYGLAGIRERARLLGGNVTIDSCQGEGTTITVELPIDVGDLSE